MSGEAGEGSGIRCSAWERPGAASALDAPPPPGPAFPGGGRPSAGDKPPGTDRGSPPSPASGGYSSFPASRRGPGHAAAGTPTALRPQQAAPRSASSDTHCLPLPQLLPPKPVNAPRNGGRRERGRRREGQILTAKYLEAGKEGVRLRPAETSSHPPPDFLPFPLPSLRCRPPLQEDSRGSLGVSPVPSPRDEGDLSAFALSVGRNSPR